MVIPADPPDQHGGSEVTADRTLPVDGQVDLRTPGVRTVLVCDDQKSLRDAVSLLVANDPQFRVVGQAVDGSSCVDLLAATVPDILIIDVSMPGGGPALVRRVRTEYPDLHIVVYSGRDDVVVREQMLLAGANVYVLKTGRLKPLIDALDHGAQLLPGAHSRVEARGRKS